MRIHIFGSIAVPTIPRLTVCAFNQTAIKYAAALKDRGHHIIFYGTKEFESQLQSICSEFVANSDIETFKPLISMQECKSQFKCDDTILKEWQKWFGETMWHPKIESLSTSELEDHLINAFGYGPYLSNQLPSECMEVVNEVRGRVRIGMNAASDYIQPGDIMLTYFDTYAYDLFKQWEEKGAIVIGGLFQCGSNKCRLNRSIFSSQFMMTRRNKEIISLGQHYYVIPPFFRPSEFIFNPEPRNPTGPFLYMARLQWSKGAIWFMELVKLFPNLTFWIAGPGKYENGNLYIPDNCGNIWTYPLNRYPNLKYWGVADKSLRVQLLSSATALIQPSDYDEPFGWNVVEANLCGTPAIAPERGAFLETIESDVNGYRYPEDLIERQFPPMGIPDRIKSHWEIMMGKCSSLSPSRIRDRAIDLYSEDVIIPNYIEALEKIRAEPGSLLIED